MSDFSDPTDLPDLTDPFEPAESSDWIRFGTHLLGYQGPGGAVTIPDTVSDLTYMVWNPNGPPITALTIPGSVDRVPGGFAENLTDLRFLELEEGVEEVDILAFSQCEKLEKVILPRSLRSFPYGNFEKCPMELTLGFCPRGILPLELKRTRRITVPADATAWEVQETARYLAAPEDSELVADGVPVQSLPAKLRLRVFRAWETRMRRGESVPEATSQDLRGALKANRVALWRSDILRQELLEGGLLSLQNVRSFLASAQESEDPELVARLLDYQNRHFPPEEVERRDRRNQQRALRELCRPIEEHAADWKAVRRKGSGTEIIRYQGTDSSPVIPTRLKRAGVTALHWRAMSPRNDRHSPETIAALQAMEEITVPEGIRFLYWGVFDGCENLRRVTLPSTLEEIGEFCFSATALEELVIPASVQLVGRWFIEFCPNLKRVVLENPGTVLRDRELGTWPEGLALVAADGTPL